jgi:hypothetical protein
MTWYTIIAAAWFSTIVIRKLPVVRGLVERGVKPWSCDCCMAAWLTLFWRLGALEGCQRWGVVEWLAFVGNTAALAAAVYVLLWGWAALLRAAGWHDDPKPADYSPPGEAT